MALYPHDRLREARERAGYPTAAAFAKLHDFTESTYRSHENGARGLTVAAARRYGELLGVPWTWIMDGTLPGEKADGKSGESGSRRAPLLPPGPRPLRPRVDVEVLAAIIERVEANLARRRRKMSPLHKAELVANSYALVDDLGLEAATREIRSGLRGRAAARSA